MKNFVFILTLLCIFSLKLHADYYDSGMIEMKQPNGVIFTGRGWGDEFAFQYETNNGYRFVKAIDGYYYFATLNAKGEFVKTKLKVGIDSAPAGSYKLDRSADRLAEIDSERVAFNQEVSSNAESFKAKMSALNGLKSVTAEIINLAVICVKFSDTDDNIISHDTRYEKANFEDMLFSQDYWYETNPDGVNDIHPDGHQIFGSVRDFYWQQSLGKKEIIGNVVNSAFHVEFVDWLELPLVKLEYHNNYSENQFADTVMTRAVNAGLFDPADYSYIVIIYAGKREDGGALGPQNFSEIAPYGKSGYIINETYGDTEASAEFGHIGVHAHELGHKFGASDAYVYYPDPRQWSLMSTGSHNGPNFGSCPAGIAPHYKIDWEWVNVSSEITSATSDYSIAYNYDNPVYVKVPIPGSSEYFLLENRLKDSFDKHTPKVYGSGTVDPNDPNRYYGGLLIWHFKPGNGIYIEEIEQADNEINPNEGDPFPFLGQGQDFNDTSIPASHARDGDYSNVSINNIRWIEDGSPSNGYSMVDIEFFENATEIEGNTTWNSDMTLSGPVYVRSNAQLIINAGVDIDVSGPFNNQIKFIVEDNASLKFNGTSANPVTVIPSSGDWGGIEMEGTSSLEILHTTLKNAVRTINFSGSSTSNSCNISNSTIENSQTTLTLIGSIAIDNSMFINAPLALKTIPDGEIGHTVFHSDYSNKNGIHVQYPANSNINIENCTLVGWEEGIHIGALYKAGPGESGEFVYTTAIQTSIFSNCQTSIAIGTNPENFSAWWNNFYGNGSDPNKGTNWISVNPQYVNAAQKDYHLQWGSSCIDAGPNGFAWKDPDGTANDLGSFYYDQTPIRPSSLTFTGSWGQSPTLHWPIDAPHHISYKVYAHYVFDAGGYEDAVYTTTTNSYTDTRITLSKRNANQTITYTVTSLNSINTESAHSNALNLRGDGGISKMAVTDSIISNEPFIPSKYKLHAAFPNPFNPTTNIVFDIPNDSFVSLTVFDISGKMVAKLVERRLDAGRYTQSFDASDLASGLYLYRIVAGSYIKTNKLLLVK